MGGIIIRKVNLSMDEQKKYEVIKKLVDEHANKQRAAITLGCTVRHINRMICGYKAHGKEYFIHGNRGRKPAITIPEKTKQVVLDLYRTKYYDANFQHFKELLATHEGINISCSSVAGILEAQYILSPKVTHAKKKRIKKLLEHKKKTAKNKKERNAIQTNLVAVNDAHSRRPRCAYFGELEQMDASSYVWFGSETATLHLAIDDATGAVTGAYFDKEETLNGYYHIFHQILKKYGIPYKFFTDRRTVFTYKSKKSPSIDEDTYTQFAYACNQLGVELESSSIPQAKGRVERLNQTLQSRLPVELRLAGITTIDAANEFLNSYVKEFNAKFSLPLDDSKSVFEVQPSDSRLNLILAVLTARTIDAGHCIKFKNSYYRMLNSNGVQVHYCKGTKVMTIESFDKRLFCCVNDKDIYALELIPKRATMSPDIDSDYKKPTPRKQYIPAMNHPWRRSLFTKFVKSQKHHWDDPIDESA